MSFALALAVMTAIGVVVVGCVAATPQSSAEDEPPSPRTTSPSRQVVAVVVAALLEDGASLLIAFAPPSAPRLCALPPRDWGTVVVERPRSETLRRLEAWRQTGERLVLVAEGPADARTRQVRVGLPDGPTVVLAA